MYIDEKYFLLINILVLLFLVLSIYAGYNKGFLRQVISLFGLLVAIIISSYVNSILSDMFDLWPHSWYFGDQRIFDVLLYDHFNNMAWFVVVVIILMLLFLLLRPIVAFLEKLPLIKQINNICGLFSGFIVGVIWIYVFCLVLTLPFFTNGKMVVDKTLLNVVSKSMAMTSEYLEKPLLQNEAIIEIINDNIDLNDKKWLEDWMVKNHLDELPIEKLTQGDMHE